MKSPRKPNKSSFLFDLFGFPLFPIQGALRVKKRDGHVEPFNLQKLSASIKKALQSAEVYENGLEYSLATAIKTYLRECHGLEAIVSSEEINAITIQVLQEMGQTKTLRNYKEFRRQKHLQQRLIAKDKDSYMNIKKSDDSFFQGLFTDSLSNDDLIVQEVDDLLKPLQLKKQIQEKIIQQLLGILHKIQHLRPSSIFISELAGLLLKKEGIPIPFKQPLVNLHVNECIEVIKSIRIEERTPEDTDIILGKKVKEQVSRSLIFSSEIIEAHDNGIIYLHVLDQLDRLWSLNQPSHSLWLLERKRSASIQTPRDFWDLLIDTYYEWTDYFMNPITWWGFNWSIAPLLKGLEGNDYNNWLFQWMEDCEEISEDIPGMQVVLDWAIPEKWANTSALGHRGINLGTPYSTYQQTAQEMMYDALECINRRETKSPFLSDSLLWRFNLPLQIAPSHGFWNLLVSCVEEKRVPITTCFTPLDLVDISPQIGLGGITINLARIAYKQPKEEYFYSFLYQVILLTICAYEEMLSFFTTHYSDIGGTIWKSLLEQVYKKSGDVPSITAFPVNLYLGGIREAVQILNINKEQKDIEILEQSKYILKRIKSMIRGCLKNKNLKLQLCLETNTRVLRKLAQKDMDELYDLFIMINREESFQYVPQYSDEMVPLCFYHPDELVAPFKELFRISQLLDNPVQARFAPQRVWDGLLLGEVVDIFTRINDESIPISFRFIPSE